MIQVMILIFYPYRIQGSKRHRIPDPDPQHWLQVAKKQNHLRKSTQNTVNKQDNHGVRFTCWEWDHSQSRTEPSWPPLTYRGRCGWAHRRLNRRHQENISVLEKTCVQLLQQHITSLYWLGKEKEGVRMYNISVLGHSQCVHIQIRTHTKGCPPHLYHSERESLKLAQVMQIS